MIKSFFLLLFLLVASDGYSLTITAAVGGGNWSSTASWVGAATPTASDDVLLAITSGPMTVDTGTCVSKSVTATAFINNLNFSAGQTLTVSGNVQFDTIVSGMTLTGTGVLAINAISNILSAGQTFPGSMVLSGTTTLADTWTVTGNLSQPVGGGGQITINSNQINVNGSIPGSSFAGTATINMTGSGSLSCLGASSGDNFYPFTSNLNLTPSGTVTVGQMAYSTNTFKCSSGVTVTPGSNLFLTASCGVSFGPAHWSNIYLPTRTAIAVTLLSNLIADGTLGCAGQTFALTAIPQTMTGAFSTSVGGLEIKSGMNLRFSAGQTITVSNYFLTGSNSSGQCLYNGQGQGTTNATLSSLTASSAIFLNYTGGNSGSLPFNCNMTDVTALGSIPLTIWTSGIGNVLTRTSNVTTATFTPAKNFVAGIY